jgi:hypothetical protein
MKIHPFSRAFVKPLVAALPALAAGLIWQQWLPLHSLVNLVLACLVIGGFYLAALLVLGLDQGDRMMIEAFRARITYRMSSKED